MVIEDISYLLAGHLRSLYPLDSDGQWRKFGRLGREKLQHLPVSFRLCGLNFAFYLVQG